LKDPKGVSVEGEKTYTLRVANIKGIVFFDENGKEIGTHMFKISKKDTQTFKVPNECKGIGFKRSFEK
jgi:hypothetical protein